MLFQNREHAARLLARRLSAYYKNTKPLVLAIPRGAIRMAEIIADTLGGELDILLVHKLGAPGQPAAAHQRRSRSARGTGSHGAQSRPAGRAGHPVEPAQGCQAELIFGGLNAMVIEFKLIL